MTHVALTSCMLLGLSVSQIITQPSDCSWTDASYGVSFNFFTLALQPGQFDYYRVDDSIVTSGDNAGDSYTYYFNLCYPVQAYPQGKDDLCTFSSGETKYSYCSDINDSTTPHSCIQEPSDRPQIENLPYAYQFKNNDELCVPLSGDTSSDYSIQLYDEIDPTNGITIVYSNGAYADTCRANREFKVNLICENNAQTVPRESDVIEYGTCKYELNMYTIHGCPSGCARPASSLCSAQGLCGYDYTTNRSRCFCYWGFLGEGCQFDNRLFLSGTPLDYFVRVTDDAQVSRYQETFKVEIPLTDIIREIVLPQPVNVTYDLSSSGVHSYDTLYQVNDTATGDSEPAYLYYFNIGGTIDSSLLPDACSQVVPPCADLADCHGTTNSTIPTERLGFAYRYEPGGAEGAKCVMLGSSMEKPWDLFDDPDDPAHGITIRYSDGSYISDEDANCQLKLNLVCPQTRELFPTPKSGIITDSSDVLDLGRCLYELTYETPYACPFNCIEKNHEQVSVCSGNGMCIADPAVQFVRCACDQKYYGDTCNKEVSTETQTTSSSTTHDSHAGFNITIVIISVLLIAVGIATAYLWLRNKTLEKYAVPMLDEHDHIEPTVPDYSDSDSEHFHNRPTVVSRGRSSGAQEMIKMTVNSNTAGQMESDQEDDADDSSDQDADDDDNDQENQNNGPSTYLVANQDDDDSESTD